MSKTATILETTR